MKNILFIILSITPWSLLAQKMTITTAALAERIGITDSLKLTVSIVSPGTYSQFTIPAFDGFTVITRTNESSSATQMKNGKPQTVKTDKRTYLLQPVGKGRFIIPPFTAIDANGRTCSSNKLTIEVVSTSQPAARLQRNYTEVNTGSNNLADIHSDEYQNSVALLQKLVSAGQPFILATGPLSENKDNSNAYFAEVAGALEKRATYTFIGAYSSAKLPQRYYGISDTNGLSAAMQAVNKKYAPLRYYTAIGAPRSHAINNYAGDVRQQRVAWTKCNAIITRLKTAGNDLSEKREVRLSISFFGEEDRDECVAHFKKLGFKVSDSAAKAGYATRFHVKATTTSAATPDALFALANSAMKMDTKPNTSHYINPTLEVWDTVNKRMVSK